MLASLFCQLSLSLATPTQAETPRETTAAAQPGAPVPSGPAVAESEAPGLSEGKSDPKEPQATVRTWQPLPAGAQEASVLSAVLPCGLRVIIGQDRSLPVAAVVLGVPSGEGDDPGRNPGLVHALAYALQMGNRELSPGAALDEVYDSGGFAEMAVGAGQSRFESLIPQWSLKGVLRVEADRFSTPTLSKPLWLKSLQFAAQDRRPPHAPHLPQRALAYDDPAFLRDGRVVLPPLAEIPLTALSRYLAQHFRYDRSTLAVVSSDKPYHTLKNLSAIFAKVKKTPRSAPAPRKVAAVAPAPAQSTDDKGWWVRPLPADPAARELAQVLCETLNRPHKEPGGPTLQPLGCIFHDDPSHPFLQIPRPVDGPDLKTRMSALSSGKEDKALAELAKRVQKRRRAALSSALAKARHLVNLPEWPLSEQGTRYALHSALGAVYIKQAGLGEQGAAIRALFDELSLLSPSSYRLLRPKPKPKAKKN